MATKAKKKAKKPAAKKATRTTARKAPAKKAAPRKKSTVARRRLAITPKKGYAVECKKTKTGPWEELCCSTSKATAVKLAHMYAARNPMHGVRVKG